ncbi:hypothetical protein CN326_09145 [Bacillus sp. AFS018417]|nr:hypothetical protein CN326_09145 [Bacillus sp. AFS018417]
MKKETRKIGGGQLPAKARLVRAFHQWGMKKTPTDGSFTLYKEKEKDRCKQLHTACSILFLIITQHV